MSTQPAQPTSPICHVCDRDCSGLGVRGAPRPWVSDVGVFLLWRMVRPLAFAHFSTASRFDIRWPARRMDETDTQIGTMSARVWSSIEQFAS